MPVASVIAAVVGFLLMFWRRTVAFVKRCVSLVGGLSAGVEQPDQAVWRGAPTPSRRGQADPEVVATRSEGTSDRRCPTYERPQPARALSTGRCGPGVSHTLARLGGGAWAAVGVIAPRSYR